MNRLATNQVDGVGKRPVTSEAAEYPLHDGADGAEIRADSELSMGSSAFEPLLEYEAARFANGD